MLTERVGMRLAMKKFLKKYWHWIVVTLIPVVMILVSADLTLVGLVRTQRSVERLEREIERYRSQIEEDSLFLENIKDDEAFEKYVRERHLMHADGEEVFLVE